MSVKISVTNLQDVLAGLNAKEAQIDEAVGYAIGRAALLIETRARENASGRPGPNVRTGNLRRSITARPPKKGFGGNYEAEVQATMVYARAVELGRAEWKSGVKYPYLGPAARDSQANGSLSMEFTMALASRLRG